MIVVLGPAELAEALVANTPGELVVGARDDERLGGPIVEAAEVASAIPLPARACVIAGWSGHLEGCAAARAAGGSLEGARLYVIGDPPSGMSLAVWRAEIDGAGAVAVRDVDELRARLEGRVPTTAEPPGGTEGVVEPARDGAAAADAQGTPGGEDTPPPFSAVSDAERRAMRPGAPEAAAWREAMRSARTGRLQRLLRRKRLTDTVVPEQRLDAMVRSPIREGSHSIAVLSPKGGVGKTTLSFLLGSVLARVRRERVLVVDTNPDFGTLADLVPAIVPATISDLLRDLDTISSYEELSSYTTTTETGMQILAAPQDPREMSRLGRDGYRAVSDVLHRHYDMVLYDCGTGFLDEVTQFALRRVDQVVLVSTASLVTTKIVVAAIDHLGATGFDPSRVTLAVNMVHSGDLLDRRRLRTAMFGRVGGIVEVPYDAKVQRAMDLGEFVYGKLSGPTRSAVKRLAAEVVGRVEDIAPQQGSRGTGPGRAEPRGSAGGAQNDHQPEAEAATLPDALLGDSPPLWGDTAEQPSGGAPNSDGLPGSEAPPGGGGEPDGDATPAAPDDLLAHPPVGPATPEELAAGQRRRRGRRLAFDWDPAGNEEP